MFITNCANYSQNFPICKRGSEIFLIFFKKFCILKLLVFFLIASVVYRLRGRDSNGGVQAAGAWRLLMDQVDLMDQMDKRGAPRDNPWVCMPLSGLARVMICRWGVLA